jgi:hypothetical protein
MSWKKMRQGEEKAEVALNTSEPDGSNNGKTHVDDADTAHGFTHQKEAWHEGKRLKPLKERLAEVEQEAATLRKKMNKR